MKNKLLFTIYAPFFDKLRMSVLRTLVVSLSNPCGHPYKLFFTTCLLATIHLQGNTAGQEYEIVSLPIQYDSVITITSAYIPLQSDQTRTLLVGKIQTQAATEATVQRSKINDYASSFLKKHRPEATETQHPEKSKSLDAQSIVFLKALAKNIEQDLAKNKIDCIKAANLDTIFLHTLRSTYASLSLTPSFIKEVDGIISAYFTNNDMPLTAIPKEMKTEFGSRRIKLMLSIQATLDKRKKDDMSDKEITAMVTNTFEAFIERAQHIYTWNWVKNELDIDKSLPFDSKTSSLPVITNTPITENNKAFVPYLKKRMKR